MRRADSTPCQQPKQVSGCVDAFQRDEPPLGPSWREPSPRHVDVSEPLAEGLAPPLAPGQA
eukprot:8472712-Lingulodinium_polyedra.AAC.1